MNGMIFSFLTHDHVEFVVGRLSGNSNARSNCAPFKTNRSLYG
jgi:hypothetical protein